MPRGWKLRVAVPIAVLVIAATCAVKAAAAPPRLVVELAYEVAPGAGGCPRAEEFRASVNRQLGYEAFRDGADRRVAVRISRKEGGFAGWVRWSDAGGSSVGDRRLSSRRPECDEIAANVAFAVAVQIQLLAALAPADSGQSAPAVSGTGSSTSSRAGTSEKSATDTSSTNESAPGEKARDKAAPAPAAPESEVRTPAEPERESASRSRIQWSVGLGPSVALGFAPHPMALGRIFASGRFDWVSFELAVDGALPVTNRKPDGSGFSLDRLAAGAAACGHVQLLAACLTGTLGRLEASGSGVDRPASPAGLFSQVGARLAARGELWGRYFVAARLEGLVMLAPWSVTLDDTIAWTTPRVSALLGVDLGVIFF